MPAAPLEPVRLAQFARLLGQQRRQRVPGPELWRAFAHAFPHRPAGPAERQLLLDALEELQALGLVRLPAEQGRRWDRTTRPAVPMSVELVRESPLAAPASEWRRFPWHPALAWVGQLPRLSPEQLGFLERVHRGLVNGEFADRAPLKYRSLQLTGYEKRLAAFAHGSLFAPGRLTLELLGCLPDVLPLAWEGVGDGDAMLVFENAGPFTVACNVLRALPHPPYGMVAYGAGRGVLASLGYLPRLARSVRSIEYVGDLDVAGLEILRGARERAAALELAPVRPATRFHAAMLRAAGAFGAGGGWPAEGTKPSRRKAEELAEVLEDSVAAQVSHMLQKGHRIPEEVLGPREIATAAEML